MYADGRLDDAGRLGAGRDGGCNEGTDTVGPGGTRGLLVGFGERLGLHQ